MVLTRGRGRDLEVFLVKRSPALRFLGGYWVFPGGVVDRMDRGEDGEEDELTSTRCAIRELFEETGVLPAALARAIGPEEREVLRGELLRQGFLVPRWCEALARTPAALESVRPFCRLITPPFSRLRYTTSFHHLELPAGEGPSFSEGELVDGRFWSPREVLDAWVAGEIPVSPPTLLQLGLHRGSGVEEWLAACAHECGRIVAGRLEVARQSPGITVLPLLTDTQPPALSTSCYLVGHERVWIVDPAPVDEGERARLFEITDEWREEGRRFEGILLTHHHPDHVGAVEVVARRYGLAVHAHPWTLEHLPFRPDESRALDEGDEIDLGAAPDGSPDWRLRVLHTPGHAPGHLVFLESRYRAAVVGDMLSTASTIVIDPPEGHMATYLASLERLVREGIGSLHPAHGIQHLDGPGLVRHYLAHRREREEGIFAALGPEPASPDEILARAYADAPEELLFLARRSLLAGLIKLEEEGRAERGADGWRRRGRE